MSGRSRGRLWLHRNRWWLPALPVSLALMLAAHSYRLADFWWYDDSHLEVAAADQGELVDVDDPGFDPIGRFDRRYGVRLVGVSEMPGYQPDSVSLPSMPPDTVAVRVRLDFEADPDEVLGGCRIVLRDAAGTAYSGGLSDPLVQGGYLCTPSDRTGPMPSLYADGSRALPPGSAPRPEQWSVGPVFVIPDGVEITEVRLSFEPPEYVTLRPDPRPDQRPAP